jgi:hypothetical protein
MEIDYLLKVIFREIISDSGLPPQIVDIPEEGFAHSPITMVVNENTARLLDALAREYGTTREGVAKSILHACAVLVEMKKSD